LHFQNDPIAAFFPFLQKGFYVEITPGNLQDMLCQMCGIDSGRVRDRIQTLFLNGKPVDDLETVFVQDGDCLALSAAMPGLVGATMRSGGVLAGFRNAISYRPAETQSNLHGGVLSIKLFNLLIKEMGPRFLRQGILMMPDDLRNLLASLLEDDWKNVKTAELNAQVINTDALAEMGWLAGPGFVRLEVTLG